MRLFLSLVFMVFAAPAALAYNEADCAACVSSYYCDSYQKSCLKECEAKATADPASLGSCEAACKTAQSSCVEKATKDCADYCKK